MIPFLSEKVQRKNINLFYRHKIQQVCIVAKVKILFQLIATHYELIWRKLSQHLERITLIELILCYIILAKHYDYYHLFIVLNHKRHLKKCIFYCSLWRVRVIFQMDKLAFSLFILYANKDSKYQFCILHSVRLWRNLSDVLSLANPYDTLSAINSLLRIHVDFKHHKFCFFFHVKHFSSHGMSL